LPSVCSIATPLRNRLKPASMRRCRVCSEIFRAFMGWLRGSMPILPETITRAGTTPSSHGLPAPTERITHWFGTQKGEGFEYHLLAIAIGVVIALRGSGALSLDQLLARSRGSVRVEMDR